ncbi:MAG: hypothetical protein IJB38_00115 [Bacteroidales bacterium]|nr:hypothetical protein [Bacteroidales bacterium]
MMKTKVLYIHGMGGGGDSRIPAILKSSLTEAEVVVRTYDFDPEKAAGQIGEWIEELKPSLIVGESLGAIQAIRIKGLPHILVSPSLNAPLYLGNLSFLALIPGVTWLFDRIYKPKEGDRQKLHFTYDVLKKYRQHRKAALANSSRSGSKDYFYAFFGTKDHYRRTGVVSIRTWKKYFGDHFEIYEGTHFMEEEHVLTRLVPKILNMLNTK